jgi:hypothetical protein
MEEKSCIHKKFDTYKGKTSSGSDLEGHCTSAPYHPNPSFLPLVQYITYLVTPSNSMLLVNTYNSLSMITKKQCNFFLFFCFVSLLLKQVRNY